MRFKALKLSMSNMAEASDATAAAATSSSSSSAPPSSSPSATDSQPSTMNGTSQQCENGHASPSEVSINGATGSHGNSHTVLPPGAHGAQGPVNHHGRSGSPHASRPLRSNASSHHHSPRRYSPNPTGSASSRGNSPNNQNSSGQQQHVVHVHVNPGETFSVRVGDQIQHIQGTSSLNFTSCFILQYL